MNVLDLLRQPRRWAPTLVLLLGVAIAALIATELRRSERDQRDLQESNLADGFGAFLQMHLAGCEEALRTASMVASIDPQMDLYQWRAVGRQVRVGEFDSCAKSIFYLDAGAFMQAARKGLQAGAAADGFAHRTLIAPANAAAMELAAFAPWHDPAHRAAMELARDQGQPRLTTPVVWPGVEPGAAVVVWYMPVYRRAAPLETAEERAAALSGYVGIPIQVQGVVDALSRQFPAAELTLECHAGASDMFDLQAGSSTGAGATAPAAIGARERTLRIGGRWWTLRASLATPTATYLETSTISLVSGLLLSALLAWLTWLILTQSARAHELARRYSSDAREREVRLRSVLDGTRDGICTLDVNGNVLGANSAAQEMLGYAEADLLGLNASRLAQARHGAEYLALWVDFVRTARRSAEGHGPVNELELCRKDGAVLRVRSSLTLVRTEAGELVVWMFGDVTHERALERRAHEAAALNQAIMDVAPIGVMTINADDTIATANRATHAMFGYAAGELVGQRVSILDDPDEIEVRAQQDNAGAEGLPDHAHAALAAQEQARETERVHVRKDGSRFPAGVIALPLRDADGHSLGVLRMVVDITERKRAAARIEHLALHDSLTGLPNRLLLQERAQRTLARARRNAQDFALVLLDLDHFKQINDTLGHPIGDELLRVVAQRLKRAVRDTDTVVRMGGDEFALLLPDIGCPARVEELARKVLAMLAEELSIEDHSVHVTASIGVALYPADGADLPALLKSADIAMYEAKARGRNTVSLYQAWMAESGGDEAELRADLYQALARDELVLHYQPLVRTATQEVEAIEGLLRWNHPRRGLVAPGAFVPLAEASGLIVPIGAWVLRQACADLARLRRAGRPDLRMSVNLSPRQFTADGLEACVAAALAGAGLPGSALELEITESMLMTSLERTQRVLVGLRAMGVSIAIDDFGTGYSSLSYLASFPVQTVKVDRSFVRQIDSGAGPALLAGTIVAMAHSLKCSVVAEGVETLSQHRHLADLDCDFLQGFRFSKPVPLEELAATMARVEAMPRLPPAAGGAASKQRELAGAR